MSNKLEVKSGVTTGISSKKEKLKMNKMQINEYEKFINKMFFYFPCSNYLLYRLVQIKKWWQRSTLAKRRSCKRHSWKSSGNLRDIKMRVYNTSFQFRNLFVSQHFQQSGTCTLENGRNRSLEIICLINKFKVCNRVPNSFYIIRHL